MCNLVGFGSYEFVAMATFTGGASAYTAPPPMDMPKTIMLPCKSKLWYKVNSCK